MIFHKIFDTVFSTWSHIAILRTLQYSNVGRSGREIARQSGMNHRSCLRALTVLEELSIVTRQRGGRDHLFALNPHHKIVSEGILPLLSLEQKFFEEFTAEVGKIFNRNADVIILYGSVARKEETARSDVDLCFVLKEGSGQAKIQNLLQDHAREFHKKYGASISPLCFTTKEFEKRRRRKERTVQAILQEGIILKGTINRGRSNGSS
jgi:predicted nucleotidyltransferase